MSFYFLLYCADDDSYCLHEQSDVLCDPKVVVAGDDVMFWHGNKKWNGQIVQKSRNEEYLEGELSKLNKETRRGKSAKPVESNTVIEGHRVPRKPRRSYSPSDYMMPNKKKKQNEPRKSPVISGTTPETILEKPNEDLLKGDLAHSKTNKPLEIKTMKKQTSINKSQRSEGSVSISSDQEIDTCNTPEKNDETTSSDDEYGGLSKDELKKIISKMKAQDIQGMKRNKNIESAKKDDKMRTKEKNQHGTIKDNEKRQPRQDSSDDESTAEKPSSSNQLFGKNFPGAKVL